MPWTAGPRLRILTTNDFFCSFDPQPTSYGTLPGGRGLMASAESLREGVRSSLWIDAGDFAQGGPLAAKSGGTLGFMAANRLGFDAAAAGNHEFDWGRAHLSEMAGRLSFPLLAANDEIDLPATALLDAGGLAVGIVGLSQLDEPRPGPFWGIDDWTAALHRSAALVIELAGELRSRGADFVVVAVHAGVALHYLEGGRSTSLVGDLGWLCERWQGQVDLVLGAHTLGRWVGWHAGVPLLQPWAYGAEIAFADVDDGGCVTLGVARPKPAGDWDGPGREVGPELSSPVGALEAPLRQHPARDTSIGALAARGLAELSDAGSVLVFPWEFCTQPPIDGTFAFVRRGPVTEWDLHRLVPWTGDVTPDAAFVGDVSPEEVDEVLQASPSWLGHPARADTDAGDGLAVSGHFTAVVEKWLRRSIAWERQPFGIRDALRLEFGRLG